jgi:hypothetical protein
MSHYLISYYLFQLKNISKNLRKSPHITPHFSLKNNSENLSIRLHHLMPRNISSIKNNSKNSRKMYHLYLYKDNSFQLIYINSIDMQVISTHATSTLNVTSALNQHGRDLIARFKLKSVSFN